ncbi:Hypothetical Protein FCC1311_077372, partial [Hondaea fermentalgiana]
CGMGDREHPSGGRPTMPNRTSFRRDLTAVEEGWATSFRHSGTESAETSPTPTTLNPPMLNSPNEAPEHASVTPSSRGAVLGSIRASSFRHDEESDPSPDSQSVLSSPSWAISFRHSSSSSTSSMGNTSEDFQTESMALQTAPRTSRCALPAYVSGFSLMGIFILVFLTMIILGDKRGFETFVEAQKHLIVSLPNGTAALVRSVPSIVRTALVTVGGRSTVAAIETFNSTLDLPEVSRAFFCLDSLTQMVIPNASTRAHDFFDTFQDAVQLADLDVPHAMNVSHHGSAAFLALPPMSTTPGVNEATSEHLESMLTIFSEAKAANIVNLSAALDEYAVSSSRYDNANETLRALASFRAQLAQLPLTTNSSKWPLDTTVQDLLDELESISSQLQDESLLQQWQQGIEIVKISELLTALEPLASMDVSQSEEDLNATAWSLLRSKCAHGSLAVEIVAGTNESLVVNSESMLLLAGAIYDLRGRAAGLQHTAFAVGHIADLLRELLSIIARMETLLAGTRDLLQSAQVALESSSLATYRLALSTLDEALDAIESLVEACVASEIDCESSDANDADGKLADALGALTHFNHTRAPALQEVTIALQRMLEIPEAVEEVVGEAAAADLAHDEAETALLAINITEGTNITAQNLAVILVDIETTRDILVRTSFVFEEEESLSAEFSLTSAVTSSMSEFVVHDLVDFLSSLREEELSRDLDMYGFPDTFVSWADTLDLIFSHFTDLVILEEEDEVLDDNAENDDDDSATFANVVDRRGSSSLRELFEVVDLGYVGSLVRNSSAFLSALEAAADRDYSEQALPRGSWFYLLTVAGQFVDLPAQWTNISAFEEYRTSETTLLGLQGVLDPNTGTVVDTYANDALCFMDECLVNTIEALNVHPIMAGFPSLRSVYLVLFAFPMVLVGFAFLALCCSALGNRLTAPFVVTGCLVAPVMFAVVAVGIPVLLAMGDFCEYVEPAILANVREMEANLCDELGLGVRRAQDGEIFCSVEILGEVRIDLDLDQLLQSALVECSGLSVANLESEDWENPQEPISQLWDHVGKVTGPLLASALRPYLGEGNETVLLGISFDMTAEEVLEEVISSTGRIIADASVIFDCEAFALMFTTIKEPICCELTDTVFWLVAPWLTFALGVVGTVGPALLCNMPAAHAPGCCGTKAIFDQTFAAYNTQ